MDIVVHDLGSYLSFTDPKRPKGDRFIGGAFIRETEHVPAITRAWELGINPGGQVMFMGPVPLPADEWVERLLTREEVESVPPPAGHDEAP